MAQIKCDLRVVYVGKGFTPLVSTTDAESTPDMIFNVCNSNGKKCIPQEAFFVLLYRLYQGIVISTNVLYACVVPFVEVNREGKYMHGGALHYHTVRNFEPANPYELDSQINMILSGFQNLPEHPDAIVYVDQRAEGSNENTRQENMHQMMTLYRDMYMRENEDALSAIRPAAVEAITGDSFGWGPIGLWRYFHNRTVTGYYDASDDLVARVSGVTHPRQQSRGLYITTHKPVSVKLASLTP